MIYCTSYESPDLDGVACSIAYTEYLNSLGKETKAVYFGDLGLETKFFGALPIDLKIGGYLSTDSFVLVDTADPDAIDKEINPSQIIEIFDHHLVAYPEKFPNAKSKIERVGSCSTLVWEHLQQIGFEPSQMAKTLLYGAIVSNTINFKNKVTTDRDRKAADQLKSKLKLSSDFVKDMFAYKSRVTTENIIDVLNQDFAVKEIDGKKIGIAQLEVTDLENLVLQTYPLIINFLKDALMKMDYALFTGIDIYEGFNILITVFPESDKFFSDALGIPAIGGQYKTDEIIMRKEIWPKIHLTP